MAYNGSVRATVRADGEIVADETYPVLGLADIALVAREFSCGGVGFAFKQVELDVRFEFDPPIPVADPE